jgi:ribosomal protein S18 acetylase RimI-like enzyme
LSNQSGWVPCKDPNALVDQCLDWNKGRFYEILWEYTLTPATLRERNARGWLYYEDNHVAGFALGRWHELRRYWHFEELWGPCEGSSELPTRTGKKDRWRAQHFHKLLSRFRSPTLIRAAVDNPFANIIAREVGAQWCGGYLLATRRLGRKLTVRAPSGFKLRRFRKGDEKDMSRIHRAAFHMRHPPREYFKWATNPNCRTTLAVLQGEAVGFLTAEKRLNGGHGDFNIAVEPKFHGEGLGSALMEKGLNDLIEMGCKTAVADYWLQNAKVQALNQKYGFRIVRAYNHYETRSTK